MKLKMLRLGGLVAASILTLTACAGAGEPAPTASPTETFDAQAETIQYGLLAGKPYDGEEITFVICCQAAAQFQAWRASTVEFTNLTGIEVRFTDDPLDGLREKLITESVSNPGSWDVALYFDTWLPDIAQYLEPLENVMTVDLSDYPAATADLGIWEDTIYGIPARSHVMMLYYRKDVFDQLGLTPPGTQDELLATAKLISESDLGIEGFTVNYGKQPSISPLPWINFVMANGGAIFNEDGTPNFASPEAIAAATTYRDLAQYAPSGAVAYNEGDNRTAFAQGGAAMTLAWSWAMEIFNNPTLAAEGVLGNVGYTAVIPGVSAPGNPIAMSWPVGISASSEKKGAAAEWVKWMTNQELDQRIITEKAITGQATVVANRLSSMFSEEANAETANNGFSKAMGDAYSAASHQPIYAGFSAVTEIIEVALSDIMGGADIEATLQKANSDALEALGR